MKNHSEVLKMLRQFVIELNGPTSDATLSLPAGIYSLSHLSIYCHHVRTDIADIADLI